MGDPESTSAEDVILTSIPMNTRETVLQAVTAQAKEPVPSDDESLFDCGAIDSFGLLDLIQTLEQEFGVKVPDSDLNPRRFNTVSRITAYFDERSDKTKRAGG
jgi:acyl carrier protein